MFSWIAICGFAKYIVSALQVLDALRWASIRDTSTKSFYRLLSIVMFSWIADLKYSASSFRRTAFTRGSTVITIIVFDCL